MEPGNEQQEQRPTSKLVRQRFGGPNLTVSKRERERREVELEEEIEKNLEGLSDEI